MKTKLVLLALCATTTAFAQGKIQFTWHGDQNLFQASFDVNSSVILFPPDPGPYPETTLWHYGYNVDFDTTPSGYTDNFTVTTPYRTFNRLHRSGPAQVFRNGIRNGEFVLNVIGWNWNDFAYDVMANSSGALIDGGTAPGNIWVRTDTTTIASESGYWSWPLAPEPSALALLGFGLLGLCMRRATSRV